MKKILATMGMGTALLAALTLGPTGCGDASADEPRRPRGARDVVLVHGAWADGSSWSAVIRALQDDGFQVVAPQLHEQSLAEDAALVRRAIDSIPRPVVVVGHSYGGEVASEATAGAKNVVGLVFAAAFAPDAGESLADLAGRYPTPEAINHLVVDDHLDATIDPDAYVRYFAAGVGDHKARVLSATQHPISLLVLGTPAGVPGWRSIRSYYQVSSKDEVLDPGLERFFARRMGAETIELAAGHLSPVTHPEAIVDLIERAARP